MPLTSFAAPSCVDLTRTLSINSYGEDVKELQLFLAANADYLGTISGTVGPSTQAAIQDWQRVQGIVAEGTPVSTGYGATGPRTRAAMACTKPVAASSAPAPQSVVSGGAQTRTLHKGMSGGDVLGLQLLLAAKNLLPATSVTGYFGSITEGIIQAFQVQEGIVATGTPATTGYGAVGPRTLASLSAFSGEQADVELEIVDASTSTTTLQIATTTATSSAPAAPPVQATSTTKQSDALPQLAVTTLTKSAVVARTLPPLLLSFDPAKAATNDQRRLRDVRMIQIALEAYFAEHGHYPSAGVDDWMYSISALQRTLVPAYLSYLPSDPFIFDPSWGNYQYIRGPGGDHSYALWVRFENGYPGSTAIPAGEACKIGVRMNVRWWDPPGTLCPGQESAVRS